MITTPYDSWVSRAVAGLHPRRVITVDSQATAIT
jgi:hypothetical protein